MNPSTEDIVEAVLATPAKTVFVLPNNKNIILAAEQAVPLVTDRKIIVVPTRTIPQGLSALLSFDPDASADENASAMLSAAETSRPARSRSPHAIPNSAASKSKRATPWA